MLIGLGLVLAVLVVLDQAPDGGNAEAPGVTPATDPDPATTDPAAAGPATTDPATTDPQASDPGAAPTGPEPAAVQPPAEAPAVAPVSDIGRSLTDGRFAFVVTGIVCGQESLGEGLGEKQAQGQFCTLSLQVTNVGDAPQTLHSGEQELLDAQGRRYGADGGIPWILGGELDWWTDVNPGNGVTGTLSYDLPEGVQPVAVELHDSPFSGGVRVNL